MCWKLGNIVSPIQIRFWVYFHEIRNKSLCLFCVVQTSGDIGDWSRSFSIVRLEIKHLTGTYKLLRNFKHRTVKIHSTYNFAKHIVEHDHKFDPTTIVKFIHFCEKRLTLLESLEIFKTFKNSKLNCVNDQINFESFILFKSFSFLPPWILPPNWIAMIICHFVLFINIFLILSIKIVIYVTNSESDILRDEQEILRIS